ncbi:MAG: YCF48-related protein [Acidobacteriota bacterium]|nr:YCF48-related protein [Acidobacteriota bacterium]
MAVAGVWDLKFKISNLRLRRTTTRRLLPSASCRPPLSSAPVVCPCLLLLLSAFCLLPSVQAAWVSQKSGSFAWLHSVFFVGERGWAVGGKGALLETTDGGASWQLLRPPTEDALQDVFFTDERTGFIVCVRSVYSPMKVGEPRSYLLKTTDGGATWTRVDVVGAGDDSLQLARVRFADARRGWVFGEEGALYSTEDGGATWARLRVPTRHLLLGASLLDARQAWLVGAGQTLLQTSDGGLTWREGQLRGLPARFSSSPQTARAQPTGVSAQAHSTAASAQLTGAAAQSQPSSSSPRAPQAQASSLRLNAVSFADARRGWAVGANGAVLATTDGGRTWAAQESGTDSDLFDVKFFDAREGWAVGSGGAAIHTTDGGQTWQAEQTGTTHALERLFFEGRARGWAVGFGGTIIAFKE